MVIVIVIFLIIAMLLLSVYNMKQSKATKAIVESFIETDSYLMELSEDDKKLYFSIIDKYNELLDRDPSEDELNYEFDQIKTKKTNIDKVGEKIKETMEYKRYKDIADMSGFHGAPASNDVQDYTDVVNILNELTPKVEEQRDPVFIDYLVNKFRGFKKNKEAFTSYYKKTPEYSEYLEIEKNSKDTDSVKGNVSEDEEGVNVINKSMNVEFKISRPEINKTTATLINDTKETSKEYISLIQEKLNKDEGLPENVDTCEFYKQYQKLSEETLLSDRQTKRNMDRLKYHCDMSKSYANVNSNMVLMNDQKWSVPQKHVPVCSTQNCQLTSSVSQSALIGTLLDDVEFNSKLLPSFKYEENV
jgi:DNA-binding ferritin-like protein